MRKLPPRMHAAALNASIERELCQSWLLEIMRASPKKTRTKADLQNEAIARFNVSKSSFNFAWDWAIMETGNEDWYKPLGK